MRRGFSVTTFAYACNHQETGEVSQLEHGDILSQTPHS